MTGGTDTASDRLREITGHYVTAQEAALLEARIADSFEAGGEPTEFYDVRRIEPIGSNSSQRCYAPARTCDPHRYEPH